MAKTMVIGIGGSGKGVLNWIKRVLNEKNQSIIKPDDFVLFGIDGDTDDQFVLADGTKIDMNDGSKEFLQLSVDGGPIKNNIKNNICHDPFLNSWFKPYDAKLISDKQMSPTKGFAQNRFSSRTALYNDLNTFYSNLQNCFNSFARNINSSSQYNVFICGSCSGGAGAGMMLDVSYIVRHLIKHTYATFMQNFILQGVVILPNSFNSVIKDSQDVKERDARSMAFLRELNRFMGLNTSKTGTNELYRYNNNVVINGDLMFDVCYLIDGGNMPQDRPPRDTIIQSIAHHIMHLALDPGIMSAILKNTQAKVPLSQSNQRFSSLGFSSVMYTYTDLLNQFKYNFSYKMISDLFVIPPGVSTGDAKAQSLMKRFALLNYLLQTKSNGFNFTPPSIKDTDESKMQTLLKNLKLLSTCPSISAIFPATPESDFLDLPRDVKPRRISLFGNNFTNIDLINTLKERIHEYIGQENSLNRNQLFGWLNLQDEAYQQIVFKEIKESLIDIFYERTKDGKHQPKKLNKEPFLLQTGYQFINAFKECLETSQKNMQVILQVINSSDNPSDLLKAHIDKVIAGIAPQEKNHELQKNLIQLYQRLALYLTWEAMVKGLFKIINTLSGLVNDLWRMFGDPSEGCLANLKRLSENAFAESDRILELRKSISSNGNILVMPDVNQDVEIFLFNQHLAEYLDSIFSKMSWCFAINDTNLNHISGSLYLELPAQESSSKNKGKLVKITDIVNKSQQVYMVSDLDLDAFVDIGEAFYKKPLENLTIWDLLHMDYTIKWVAERKINGKSHDITTYLKEKMNFLAEHAFTMFQNQNVIPEGAGKTHLYIALDFNTSNPDAQSFSTQFNDLITQNYTQVVHNHFSHVVSVLNFCHELNWKNWRYINIAMQNYYDYQESYFHQNMDPNDQSKTILPIHIHPEERNASKYELYRLSHGVNKNRSLFELKLIETLKDMSFVKKFVHVFLRGKIHHESSDPSNPMSTKQLFVNNPSSTSLSSKIILGKVDDIYAVLGNCQKDPIAVKIIDEEYKKIFSTIDDNCIDENEKLIRQVDLNVKALGVNLSQDFIELAQTILLRTKGDLLKIKDAS